jgi:hypothetical protein
LEPTIGRIELSPLPPQHAPQAPVGNFGIARQTTHFLDAYLGFTIEVHYNNYASNTDRGVLRHHGDGWIELVRHEGKAKQDSLLIPVEAIRMVRPIGPPHTPQGTLLRPAEPVGDDASDANP